jgi:hypothetical protein
VRENFFMAVSFDLTALLTRPRPIEPEDFVPSLDRA